jgi:NAD(P)H-dependent FMN reductase
MCTLQASGLPVIPMFDPGMSDDATPQLVRLLRSSFESAYSVVMAIPEYGGDVAGWAKKALDWMVR